MRICVFGAGAIGGNFAARLADSGNEVSVVARGAHLEAIKAKGLTLIAGDKKIVAKVKASDRPADLGQQDAVISTLKANGLAALADGVGPLLGPDTPVVFAQNAKNAKGGWSLCLSLPRPERQQRRVVLDLNPLDNTAGFLYVGHGAADRGFKTVRFPTESDNRHATARDRNGYAASFDFGVA